MDTTNIPITQTNHADERPTWRSLLLGIVVWFLYFNVNYALSSITCRWGWFPNPIAGMPGLRFVQLMISIVALLLLASMIYFPWRSWRRYQSQKPTQNEHLLHDSEKDRRPLMAFVTMLTNTIFFLIVIFSLVPILTLNVCALSGNGV